MSVFWTLCNSVRDKKCEYVLSVLRDSLECLPLFLSAYKGVPDICKNIVSIASNDTFDSRFLMMEGIYTNELAFFLYCRDPIAVIKEQVAKTMSNDIITKCSCSDKITHAVNLEIKRDAYSKAENAVEMPSKPLVL